MYISFTVRFLAKGVAINVGVNTKRKWGGFRGPIFSDGSFEFIHIPWNEEKYERIEPRPQKYSEMKYSLYICERAPDLLESYVLVSPDFCNCTYASTMKDGRAAPANKPIFSLNEGDYLLFYATLDFWDDEIKGEDWINPRWGAYIVGLFKIDSIYESLRHVLDDEVAFESFKEYTWFKSQVKVGDLDAIVPWVKGIKEESGLLKKAIPLSNPNFSQKWSKLACDLFRTSRGKRLDPEKKTIFRTVLTCENKCLEKLLPLCTLRKD